VPAPITNSGRRAFAPATALYLSSLLGWKVTRLHGLMLLGDNEAA
jgi:hypothetical protein